MRRTIVIYAKVGPVFLWMGQHMNSIDSKELVSIALVILKGGGVGENKAGILSADANYFIFFVFC